MKITEIRTGEVWGHGYSCYVRIYTDKGITGTGECIHGGAGIQQIIALWRSLILGEDPMNVDRLYEKMRRARVFDGALAGNFVTAHDRHRDRPLGPGGPRHRPARVCAAGRQVPRQVRLYADCHAGGDDSPQANADKARRWWTWALRRSSSTSTTCRARTSTTLSTTPSTTPSWTRMVAKVCAIREAVGPHIDVAMDLHGRYDTSSGIRIAQALEPFRLLWLEEPVPPENVDAMREVKRATSTPICAGENLYLRWGFKDLLEKQAVDIIMPDLPKCCGLSEGKKIASMAEVYYIPMAPHNVVRSAGHHCLVPLLRRHPQLSRARVALAGAASLARPGPGRSAAHPRWGDCAVRSSRTGRGARP